MKIIGVKVKTRCVRYDRSSKSKPWEAILHIAGKRKRVGRYETRELAEAAVQGARKAVPALPPGRPRMPQKKRQTILETYHLVESQAKTAVIHGVAESTVRRILREVRPRPEDYPDRATELI
jgi:DNA-directed RNA polymerase specialized sigma24 family protein